MLCLSVTQMSHDLRGLPEVHFAGMHIDERTRRRRGSTRCELAHCHQNNNAKDISRLLFAGLYRNHSDHGSESMQSKMPWVTALHLMRVCPLSQVEADSAADRKHLVLLDCTDTILAMSVRPVQPETLLVTALCSLSVFSLSQVEAGSAAEGKHLVLPDCTENHSDNLYRALCSQGICPLSQVEAGSANEGKHLVLPGCAENHSDNESRALCSLAVCHLSPVDAGSAAEGKHLVLPGRAEDHSDNECTACAT